jgi:hypothetical protein
MCDTSSFLNPKYENEIHVINRTYSSYQEYKSNQEEQKLLYLIRSKYLIILGNFIESMYEGLQFDVFIRHRDPKVKNMQWYGQTYMELRIYDIISLPSYKPETFSSMYKTPHYDGYIDYEGIYDNIESFMPEINKHLLISFRPLISPHTPIHNIDMLHPNPFECWSEYFSREYRKDAMRPKKL